MHHCGLPLTTNGIAHDPTPEMRSTTINLQEISQEMTALFEDAKRTLEARDDIVISADRFGLDLWHKQPGEAITADPNTYGVCMIGAGLLGRELKLVAEDPSRSFPLEDSVLRAYYPHLCADCISAGFARANNLGHDAWRVDRGHELMYKMALNFRSALGVVEPEDEEPESE
jgi:hypothetical protein